MSTIPCATQVLPSTFVAGFQFNNGRSYRLFYQAPDAAIHAFYTDDFGAKWNGGDSQMMVPGNIPKLGTPMASVIYTENNTSNSRTFYLASTNKVRMFGVQGGRPLDVEVAGGAFQAASYSRIGAISWVQGGTPHIRVYFQLPNDAIQEICWDGSGDFVAGHRFPVPLKGTALAFINRGPKDGPPSIRGYYQHSDYRIMEVCWDGGWNAGTLINGDNRVEDQTHISASVSSTGQMNVYWTNNEAGGYNSVTECVWMNGWSSAKKIAVCCSQSSARLQSTSHVPDGSNDTRIRLFFVGMNGRINDARRENGQWGWGGKQGGACQWTPC